MPDNEAIVAAHVLSAIKKAGTDTVFGLPGVHNLAFWADRQLATPRIVGVRHEQTAVYAADGYARSSGRLGVALTTTGPGAANAVAAFGEAAACRSPVLLIASEVSTEFSSLPPERTVLHSSRDQAALFEPLAKAVFRPRTVTQVHSDVATAIATALSCSRGPVYLDIPTDLLSLPCEAPQPAASPAPAPRMVPGASELAALSALLNASPRVAIWAGGGVVQSDASAELRTVAEALGAPVITTFTARGIMGPSHPCDVGFPPHEPEVASLLASADLLLAVGTDFDGMMTRNWSLPMPSRLGSINCSAADLHKPYSPDAAVAGDARITLSMLLEMLPSQRRQPWADCPQLRSRIWRRLREDPRTAPACELTDIVSRFTSQGALMIADMAIAGYWTGGYSQVSRHRQIQYPVGWGTLGYALPASVGAAHGGAAPVLVVCGDGGAMFALGELATLSQESLPVTLLVVDDQGYGMLRFDQDRDGVPHSGVNLATPDFTMVAAAFGIAATPVEEIGEPLRQALDEALASQKPHLIHLKSSLFPPSTTTPRWHD